MTPAAFQSRMSAIFLVSMNLLPSSLGPPLVGALAQRLPHSAHPPGDSMAMTVFAWTRAGVLSLIVGLRSIRAAVQQSRYAPQYVTAFSLA